MNLTAVLKSLREGWRWHINHTLALESLPDYHSDPVGERLGGGEQGAGTKHQGGSTRKGYPARNTIELHLMEQNYLKLRVVENANLHRHRNR